MKKKIIEYAVPGVALAVAATFLGVTYAPLLNLQSSPVEQVAPRFLGTHPEATSTPTPTPTPTETAAPVVEAPVVEAPVEDTPGATVDENGAVTGEGCPLPYVDNGYGCQDPICGVDENGNDVPCQP